MSHRVLPARPSLENLRKQAKDLAKAYRAGEPDAVARVAALGRMTSSTQRFTLVDAQHVVAREYGLKSWPRLVRYVALEPGARRLLDAGADPDLTCDVYGGRSTALTLLVTSVHPAAAGVQADLVEVLCRAGARPDGRGRGFALEAMAAPRSVRTASQVRCGRVDLR